MTFKRRLLPIANAIAYVTMLVINIVFQLGERTTASISDSLPTLITPAGLTFSIWIVIYGLLLVYTFRQLFSPVDYGIDELYFISSILNIIWIITWRFGLVFISMLDIIALAIVLFAIIERLKYDRTIVKTTFSIYYAWISVASIINIFAFVTKLNGSVFDTSVLRIVCVLVIASLTILAYLNKTNSPYIAVLVWALLGIIIKQISVYNGRYAEIIVSSILVMLVNIIIAFSRYIKIGTEELL